MTARFALAVLAILAVSPALGQSSDPSMSGNNIERSIIPAPTGHRQPRASDLPQPKDNLLLYDSKEQKMWDRVLKICRGC
jgi:hypothetical protein